VKPNRAFCLVIAQLFAAFLVLVVSEVHADDPIGRVQIDEKAVAVAIDNEDAAKLKGLLLPILTERFGRNIQTKNVVIWLMRSYSTDHWSVVHVCLDVRIQDNFTWSEWLPAEAWDYVGFGDIAPGANGDIPGWDPGEGKKDYLADESKAGVSPADAAKAVAGDVKRIRGDCDHSSDQASGAIQRGTLKRLDLLTQ
jgi:hypothetical protein